VIYLLDTDAVIFMARGSKSTASKTLRQKSILLEKRCRQAKADGDIVGLSAITISELEFGARYGGRYHDEISLINGLTAPFRRFDYDALDCPNHFGQVRENLERRGVAIGALDMLISAHALAISATLVSNNTAHFSRVNGLKVVNWLKE